MDCKELEHFLYPFLDGEFDLAERAEVEAHLANCAECARHVDEERRFQLALRATTRSALCRTEAPEHLRSRVRAGLSGEVRRRAFAQWGQYAAVAAMLVTMVGGTYLYLRPLARQRMMADAAARHAKRFPMELQHQSPRQIEAWFDGKLSHRISVPSFANAVPAGARLLNVQDKQAAYISYETSGSVGDAPGRIGLFVYDDQQGSNEALAEAQVAHSQGFNVVSWRDGEVGYTLVTDLDEADVRRMILERQGASRGQKLPSLSVQPASLQR